MTRKEFIKHYSNILNFPSLGIYPEKRHELVDEIQRLADIDKIYSPIALDMIYDDFVGRYFNFRDDHDDINIRDLEKAICNLALLRYLDDIDDLDARFTKCLS